MENIYDPKKLEALIQRIQQLTPDSKPLWGKMTIAEMLAHSSLVFEYNNGKRQAKVNPIMRFLLSPMMKGVIIGPKPYKRNSPTAPYFRIASTEGFEIEKARLISNLSAYSNEGPEVASSRQHVWLGKLSSEEWSWAMFKHLDHHLQQFGV